MSDYSEFLREVADSIDMQHEGSVDIPLMKKHMVGGGTILQSIETGDLIRFNNMRYEFPLFCVEGKPVFEGDELYLKHGVCVTVSDRLSVVMEELTWTKPQEVFEKDDAVLVSNNGVAWVRAYYSNAQGDIHCCFIDGKTSWSVGVSPITTGWKLCKAA